MTMLQHQQTTIQPTDREPDGRRRRSHRCTSGALALHDRGAARPAGRLRRPAQPASSFDGAAQVLVASAGELGDAAVRMNQAVISAAATAGARRILYTSHMGASATSPFPPMPTHIASEEALHRSGVSYTSLRNGFYTSTVLRLLGDAITTGELNLPEDGPICWTVHADLASAAVAALTRDDADLDGITPPLVASEALDMADVTQIVSGLTGRTLSHRTISDESYRADLVAHGAPVTPPTCSSACSSPPGRAPSPPSIRPFPSCSGEPRPPSVTCWPTPCSPRPPEQPSTLTAALAPTPAAPARTTTSGVPVQLTEDLTTVVWNPVTGCDQISAGCDNCYALRLAKRLKAFGQEKYQTDGDPRTSGPGFGIAWHPSSLQQPTRWRRPRVVFVSSMGDLFHARVPRPFLQDVFAVMAATPHHTYWLLTKRPARARALARTIDWPPNVWLGVSVEEAKVLHRLDDLRATPAPVRMLFCEPLLGPLEHVDLDGIGWVTVAGEAGRGSRPMDPDWVRSLRDQAIDAHVPFYFKQWSGPTSHSLGRELDGREWNELPGALTDAA